MSSPCHDDDSFSVDFSSELISAFDFGGLGGQFEVTGDSLFSFGSYENVVLSSVPETTRKSLRTIPTFILFNRDGIKIYCGIITLQKAVSSRIAVHI